MPSDKRNSIMAKATGLIFSLFDVTLAREVPFGIPQYIQCILHGLTYILICVPFIFADSKKCRFGGSMFFFPTVKQLTDFILQNLHVQFQNKGSQSIFCLNQPN